MTNYEQAANAIWKDLTGRSGVGNALEECDSGIQQEIKDRIAELIQEHVN